MSDAAIALCQALIRCPSVTPADAGALGVLQAALAQAGFAVERVAFSAPGTPDIDNLYARIGTGAPHLMFAGHTDVVPPGDTAAWRHDPFAGAVADGMIWGRGASDMKGGIAAFAAAAIAHVEAYGRPAGSISLLITGDEEGPAINGTVKLLDWLAARGETFDHCILGEPTNPSVLGEMMKIGRRGSLSGTLTAVGRQGHVAYPARADNPIPHLLRLLAAFEPALDAGTAHFDPSNLEIVSVDTGNPAWNVIPAASSARFNIRFNDVWVPETLETELRHRLDAIGDAYRLDFEPCNALAFLTAPDAFTDLVADVVARHTGRPRPALSTSGGTSDARFICRYGPVIEFGLAGQTMHMVDEHVPVADIEGLTAIYADIIAVYLRT